MGLLTNIIHVFKSPRKNNMFNMHRLHLAAARFSLLFTLLVLPMPDLKHLFPERVTARTSLPINVM